VASISSSPAAGTRGVVKTESSEEKSYFNIKSTQDLRCYLTAYLPSAIREGIYYNAWVRELLSCLYSTAARWERPGSLKRLRLLAGAARHCHLESRRERLEERIHQEVPRLVPAEITKTQPAPTEIPRALILKPPVSKQEKGVLYVAFEDEFHGLISSQYVSEIAEAYDLILGPTWSPPHETMLLSIAGIWPNSFYTLLSNLADATSMRRMSEKITPIPLLASSWVNGDAYATYQQADKQFDIVMVANFANYKRHWVFFSVLRKLPKHFRVAIIGVPWQGRTESVLRDEARKFGVADRITLYVSPPDHTVNEILCRSRVSLIFSRQEGSCIAVTESMLANTPVGVFSDALIGSSAFINEETGVFLKKERLAEQITSFVENSDRYRPRQWALEHISCRASILVLNTTIRDAKLREGSPWTMDLLPFFQNSMVRYVEPDVLPTVWPWYESFAQRYGLKLGPYWKEQQAVEKRAATA
jgi:glycosyltransferase involved in cell wall biosynthesis